MCKQLFRPKGHYLARDTTRKNLSICSKEGFLYAEILLKIMLFETNDPFQLFN